MVQTLPQQIKKEMPIFIKREIEKFISKEYDSVMEEFVKRIEKEKAARIAGIMLYVSKTINIDSFGNTIRVEIKENNKASTEQN